MQAQTALLKREIEAKLANRIPAALSPLAQQAPRLHSLGNSRLDAMLGGGLPLGSVCELTGPDGSGRASLALALLASASRKGACAYIDVSDMLSPQSAASAGIERANLLWVRFAVTQAMKACALSADPKSFQPDGKSHRPIHGGCGNSHPRGETKGLAPALEQILSTRKNAAGGSRRAHPVTPISRSACIRHRRLRWSGSAGICVKSTTQTRSG